MAGLNTAYLSRDTILALGLRAVGEDVMIHSTAVLHNCSAISLGSHVRIDAFTLLSAGSAISVGNNVHIGSHCSFVGAAPIDLEDFCGVSHGSRVFSSSDNYGGDALTGPTVPAVYRNVISAPVRLGRHVVIGANSVLLPGAQIGEGAAIGASSLVHGTFEPWTIYAGTPARAIKPRSKGLLEKERDYLASRGTTPPSG